MYLKKRNFVIILIAVILASSLLTVCVINPFGFFDFSSFAKLNSGIAAYRNNYYESFENGDIVDGALAGTAYSFGDPYTAYIPAENSEEFMADLDLDFTGIGVYITADTTDNTISVVSAIAGSPAEAAGLVEGDKILEIEGEPITGEQLDEASSRIKGEPGTPVTLTVLKKGESEPQQMVINREHVQIETVTSEMLPNKIGFIRISQFSKNTYDEFVEQFNALVEQEMSALILDLRNNPGGRLDIAVNIADSFIEEGNIVYTLDRNGRKEELNATPESVDVPMVILTNSGSASASEVVAGALRDHGKAVTLGEKTFGKGVVQTTMGMQDGSIIKVTTSRYYSPNGVCIDQTGIEPDVPVTMDVEKYRNLSDLSQEEDDQLQAAIEYLRNNR